MIASSLININTVKKLIKKGVPRVVSISFVDLSCLVRQTQFFPISTLTTSSPSVTDFYRMKQTFRCTLSKILDLRYCTCIFNILLSLTLSQYAIMQVLTLGFIDTALDLLRDGFQLSYLYVKIKKKNNRILKYSLDTTLYNIIYYIIFIFIENMHIWAH